jgi:hypothetical protein
MDFPFYVPRWAGTVVNDNGDTYADEFTSAHAHVHIPGPTSKVLYVLVNYQRDNAGGNDATVLVGNAAGGGTVTNITLAANDVVGGVDANIGTVIAEFHTIHYDLDSEVVMRPTLTYNRYFNGSDDFKCASVVAADLFAWYPMNPRGDGTGAHDSLNFFNSYLSAPVWDTADFVEIDVAGFGEWQDSLTTSLTAQPVLWNGIGQEAGEGQWAISYHNPSIMLALASGFCSYAAQLYPNEHIQTLGRCWSGMQNMSMGLATMADELSRCNGWPEAAFYGYYIARTDATLREKFIPRINSSIGAVVNRRTVGLLKRESRNLTYPLSDTTSAFMTLSRIHPFWSAYFFGYDYLPKDNSLDLSGYNSEYIELTDTTALYRLNNLTNALFTANEGARKDVSKLMAMWSWMPDYVTNSVRLVTMSGDVDVSVFQSFTGPTLYTLWRLVQAPLVTLPAAHVDVAMPIMAPPALYNVRTGRDMRLALQTPDRYILDGTRDVLPMIVYPSYDRGLYSDLYSPIKRDLPYLDEFEISFSGMSTANSGERPFLGPDSSVTPIPSGEGSDYGGGKTD